MCLCLYILLSCATIISYLNLSEIKKSQSYLISITSTKRQVGRFYECPHWGKVTGTRECPLLAIRDTYFGNHASLVSLLTKTLYWTQTFLSCSCWIQENRVFYISIVAYVFLIFLVNTAMFITILFQIHSVKSRTQKRSRFWKQGFLQDLKSAFSLMFLLGITWGFVFFAWGAVRILFLYLFSIFNTLQGNFWLEYCYKYSSLGLWNRNTFVTSCNSSMGEEDCSCSFVLHSSGILRGKLHRSGMIVCRYNSIAMIDTLLKTQIHAFETRVQINASFQELAQSFPSGHKNRW